ncbi:hypothetical protein GJ496_003267 [Pomphorhynchus laevis]|nr:hypothetical protein GJ496_003267 [Pomphorhynchus laevis]
MTTKDGKQLVYTIKMSMDLAESFNALPAAEWIEIELIKQIVVRNRVLHTRSRFCPIAKYANIDKVVLGR